MRFGAIGLIALVAGCGDVKTDAIECAAWTSSSSSGSSRKWPPSRPGYQSPVRGENDLPGDPDWRGKDLAFTRLEGYSSLISAHGGDEVSVMVRADQPRQAHWTVFRLG